MIRRMARGSELSRYAVIMAGGSGTRFWPRSRRALPKQFLPVRGRSSLLQDTVRRLDRLVPMSRVLVVAAAELVPLIREQLPKLPSANILIEPAARGTAACLAFAAACVAEREENALMAVFPADHVVADMRRFRLAIGAGFRAAEKQSCLVTVGIAPSSAETGYGYIEVGQPLGRRTARVSWAAKFHEKPDRETAESYFNSGRYLWNAGMFIWRLDVFQRAIEEHVPAIAHAVRRSKWTVRRSKQATRRAKPMAGRMQTEPKPASQRLYRALAPLSIDVAVLEREGRVAVVRADFGWSDVGGWGAMADLWGVDSFGNASRGDTLLIDCAGTIAYGGDRLVALLGVDDLIVVDSPDALLVCAKGRAQEVRRVVNALTKGKRRRLL